MKVFTYCVSPFNFCCCRKIPRERAASGRNGCVSSYNSIIVSRSRQELQTITSYLLSTAGEKNPYILHCLLCSAQIYTPLPFRTPCLGVGGSHLGCVFPINNENNSPPPPQWHAPKPTQCHILLRLSSRVCLRVVKFKMKG